MTFSPDYGNPAVNLAGLNMTLNSKTGNWEVTVPLPSGTWNYAYYPDGMTIWSNCDVALTDPSNTPIEAFSGDQKLSTIQVLFHEGFQVNDYSWQLLLPDVSKRGKISFTSTLTPVRNRHRSVLLCRASHQFRSTSLASIYHMSMKIVNKKYPAFYLSHGGGGLESDWFSQGRAQNISQYLYRYPFYQE
jgi:hypothetical protein